MMRIALGERDLPLNQSASGITARDEPAKIDRLIRRCQRGEDQAFGLLYKRFWPKIVAYLCQLLSDRDAAEDVAQTVFVRAFEALPRYERRAEVPFEAWLFTIARNSALHETGRRARAESMEPVAIAVRRELDGSIEDARSPDWIDDRRIAMLIELLPLPQRQVITLRYVLDLDTLATSVILGRTPTDIGSLHHRAMTFIRKRLGVEPANQARSDNAMRRLQWPLPVIGSRRLALSGNWM